MAKKPTPLFETACKIIDIDGDIGLALVVAPFKDMTQASACAEHIREAFMDKLREFFEAEGHEIVQVPHMINGQRVS